MSVSPFDSPLYRDLFTDVEVGQLFTDTADVRALMLVLGALAKVQGEQGVIPEVSGAFLHRAMMELQVDPGGLTEATGQNGVTIPGLVTALRKLLDAPEHAAYLHWGATSQDIQDTALILRLRQALTLIATRLERALTHLAHLADTHAATAQAARTYGQVATPSSFGAQVASWGWPFLAHRDRLTALRERLLVVSLSGAAGTASALGPMAAQTRTDLASALGLADPGHGWHSTRDNFAELAGWLTMLTASSGKMGEDLLHLCSSEVAEIALPGAGGSSTMPQKQNPVLPSVMVALARHAIALNGAVQGAALHRGARDGAAWFTEWLSLPQLVMAAARSTTLVAQLAEKMVVRPDRMAANLNDPLGLIHAETLSFALARTMTRPKAQGEIKAMCATAQATGTPLPDLLKRRYPDLETPPLSGRGSLGAAPAEAQDFAATVRVGLT